MRRLTLFSIVLSLLTLCGNARAQEAYFELYIATPPNRIDWSSPRNAFGTFLHAVQQDTSSPDYSLHAMGHGMGHIVCVDSKGKERDIYTALTGQNLTSHDLHNLLEKKVGLETLILAYDDGNIETSDEVRMLISSYRGRMARPLDSWIPETTPLKFIRFPIESAERCDALVEYHRAFYRISHEQPGIETSRRVPSAAELEEILSRGSPESLATLPDPGKLWFGLTLDPYALFQTWKKNGGNTDGNRAFLGGGCTSFMMGFLKILGAYDPRFEELWTTRLHIRNRLVGNEERTVPLRKLLLSERASSWTPAIDAQDPSVETHDLMIWDPEKIWKFIDAIGACNPKSEGRHFNRCQGPYQAWYEDRVHQQKGVAPIEKNLDLEDLDLATNPLKCGLGDQGCARALPVSGVELSIVN